MIGTASAMIGEDGTVGLIIPYDDCVDFLKDYIFAYEE